MSKEQKTSLFAWLQRLVGASIVVTAIPAGINLFAMGIIPDKYLYIVIPLYVVIAGVVLWQLMCRSKAVWRGVLFMVIGMVMITVNIAVYKSGHSVNSFLNAVQPPQVNYVEYTVIAKKNRSVVLDSARSVGMVGADTLRDKAAKALAGVTPAAQSSYDSLMALTEQLNAGAVELASIRTANMGVLQENYREFYDSVATLATYKVRDDNRQAAPKTDVTKPFVLYISGIDTYGDVGEVSRSDVNMLAVMNPAKRTMLLVNTPRDYYIQLHGVAGIPDKLTHAGIYGIDMSQQTLGDLYGVEIPYYVRLNFTSLVKMVDVVGDITVDSDYAFHSFQAGKNTLDSKRTLEFARERYSFSDGDRQRGRNQQKVIEAIVAKMSEPRNLTRYNAILSTLQSSLQTNMSQETIASLIKMQLNDFKGWQVESMSVDGAGATRQTYSMGAMPLYVMIPDSASVERAKERIGEYLQS